MIYLLFGPDKYRLEKRIAEIKKSSGIGEQDPNHLEISSDFNVGKIISEATAMPFLAKKRVLQISGIFNCRDKVLFDDLASWLPSCPAETDLIFVESDQPDQRLSFTKALNSVAKVENFATMTAVDTMRFIEQTVKERGGTIDRVALNTLQLYVGSDLVRIVNEVDKLVTYNIIVTKESVDLLVDAGYFNTIFDLTDAISAKNQKRAMELLEKALESGENESYLLSMMAMQIRNLLMILDLSNHRLSEPEIVSKTKLHPYVVKKTVGMVKNFDIATLIMMHRELLSMEESMKSTSYDPRALITSFVIKITSK